MEQHDRLQMYINGETQTYIQIFADWPMSHVKRVTKDNRKNPEYHKPAIQPKPSYKLAVNVKKHVPSITSKLAPTIWSLDTSYRIPCFDRCQLTTTWMSNIKDHVRGKLRLYDLVLAGAWPPCCATSFFVVVLSSS